MSVVYTMPSHCLLMSSADFYAVEGLLIHTSRVVNKQLVLVLELVGRVCCHATRTQVST